MDQRRAQRQPSTNQARSAIYECIRKLISVTLHLSQPRNMEAELARKTVLVCDKCGREVDEGKGATMRLSFSDARRGAKEADLCDSCATGMPGRATARRGRKPKAVAA
jgi:hypothetical protein